MIRYILFCFMLLCSASANASMLWRSTERYLQDSTLIAILRVGEIHQHLTPEGILVQSGTATIEKIVYAQSTTVLESGTLRQLRDNDVINLYAVFPDCESAGDVYYPRVVENSILMLKEGRIFAVLKQQGIIDFIPFDRLSIQKLDKTEMIYWPLEDTKDKVGLTEIQPLVRVLELIESKKVGNDVAKLLKSSDEFILNGHYDRAYEFGKKALALDPTNQMARFQLEKIDKLIKAAAVGDFMTEHEKKIRGEGPKEVKGVNP